MAKKDKLDKDSAKRLEKLGEAWREKDFFLPEKLYVSDLRLLLENFAPLQELIRQLAAPAALPAHAPSPPLYAPLYDDAPDDDAPNTPDPQELETAHQELQAARQALAQQQQQLEQQQAQQREQLEQLWQLQAQIDQRDAALADLTDKATLAEQDLKACNATANKLQKDKENAKEEIKTLKAERKQLDKDLQQAQSALADAQAAHAARTRPAPELALLRSDPPLAQGTGLAPLPDDDTQALIQTVAVLSQLDSIKRLWNVLKDRCEAERRSATNDERALLQAALGWHNHNWPSKPYRLLDVTEGNSYDYQAQLRSRHTPKGETVAALLLPGIAPHTGQALCQPLVSLH